MQPGYQTIRAETAVFAAVALIRQIAAVRQPVLPQSKLVIGVAVGCALAYCDTHNRGGIGEKRQ